MSTREANPKRLLDMVRAATEGQLLLPEFQRSFIWAAKEVEELLVSILKDYFIGNFLVLETSRERSPFPSRLLEGIEHIFPQTKSRNDSGQGSSGPMQLMLDGQQRLTSIFYTLYAPPISLDGSRYPYHFFLDLATLLKDGPEGAVQGISTSNNPKIAEARRKVSTGEFLPFTLLGPDKEIYKWLYQEQTFLQKDEDRKRIADYIQVFLTYNVPVISISDSQGTESVVETFERINKFGTRLSTFDLLVARLYPDKVKLRDLWKSAQGAYKDFSDYIGDDPEVILKALCLTRGSQCKKTDVLKLSAEDFETDWQRAVKSTSQAIERLRHHYGIISARWSPFRAMVVP